jgi:hypothetical protein
MIPHPRVAKVLRELQALATAGVGDDVSQSAASATAGLPVYSDLGGILAITPEGVVRLYDPETGSVSDVADERWRRVALVSASEKHPSLADLLPARPTHAAACGACEGTGKFRSSICRVCSGLGWIDP